MLDIGQRTGQQRDKLLARSTNPAAIAQSRKRLFSDSVDRNDDKMRSQDACSTCSNILQADMICQAVVCDLR